MPFKSVLITGANRGIGLEFVRQFASLDAPPEHLIAACRVPKDAKELNKLASKHPNNIHIVPLDVTAWDSHAEFTATVSGIVGRDGLDLLVNNAGILYSDRVGSISHDHMIHNLEVNSVAPLMITQTLLPLLTKSASAGRKTIVAMMSSEEGSIADTYGGNYPYRASKAALNMISKSLAVDLSSKKIWVAIIHPGWASTDMGGSGAPVSPKSSIAGMLKILDNFKRQDSGKYYQYDGSTLNW